MIDDKTVQQIAQLMAMEHRLDATRIAADVLDAVADSAEGRATWLKINQAVWRTLQRTETRSPGPLN